MSDELDLGNLAITITDGEPAEAKFDLPNGTSITRTFPESGTINMRLGLGLSLSHQRPPAAEGGGGEPAWLEALRAPSGDLPTVALRFLDTNYWDGSAEAALSELITLAGTDTTLDAGGLNIPQTASADPALATGALFTLLATQNWTIAATFLVPAAATNPNPRLVRIYSDPSGTDALSVEASAEAKLNCYEYDATNYREAVGVATFERDIEQKLFLTRTAAKLVGSLNSETLIVSEGGTAAVFTGNHVYIGNAPNEGGENYFIRDLVVYPPQPDADMAAILALL